MKCAASTGTDCATCLADVNANCGFYPLTNTCGAFSFRSMVQDEGTPIEDATVCTSVVDTITKLKARITALETKTPTAPAVDAAAVAAFVAPELLAKYYYHESIRGCDTQTFKLPGISTPCQSSSKGYMPLVCGDQMRISNPTSGYFLTGCNLALFSMFPLDPANSDYEKLFQQVGGCVKGGADLISATKKVVDEAKTTEFLQGCKWARENFGKPATYPVAGAPAAAPGAVTEPTNAV